MAVGVLTDGPRAVAQAELKALPSRGPTAQTAPQEGELARIARRLGDAQAPVRKNAARQLSQLGPDALGSIERRLKQLAGQRPPLDAALTAMTRFRTIQGSTRADDNVDLAKGIEPVLAQQRSRDLLRMAEPLLYLRALERMGTPEAADVIVSQLFALEDKVWRWESHRTLQRLGAVMLPAMWTHQSHEQRWVRKFCRWGIDKLGLRNPGLAVQQDNPQVLAGVLRAYGDTLHFPAMPSVVAFVGSSKASVRQAARYAVERFGRNAIWQIREAYLNATGKDADPNWGHKQALRELYAWHDRPRIERAQLAARKATTALDAGDLHAASRALDAALAAEPHGRSSTDFAALYARLGALQLERKAADALPAFRRALRLAPGHARAAAWRAQVEYLQGQRRLAAGLVDVGAYRAAAQLNPAHDRAAAMLDQLSGARASRASSWRRAAGLLAALLLALAALFMLRSRPDPAEPEAEPS